MTTELERHIVGTKNGGQPLLEWIKNHTYRNYASLDESEQLDFALKIAKIEDKDARELMLSLLRKASVLQEVGEEMHRELDTIHNALTKINESTKDLEKGD